MKNSPILIESVMEKKPRQVSCGAYHTLMCTGKYFGANLLLEDGIAYAWGEG